MGKVQRQNLSVSTNTVRSGDIRDTVSRNFLTHRTGVSPWRDSDWTGRSVLLCGREAYLYFFCTWLQGIINVLLSWWEEVQQCHRQKRVTTTRCGKYESFAVVIALRNREPGFRSPIRLTQGNRETKPAVLLHNISARFPHWNGAPATVCSMYVRAGECSLFSSRSNSYGFPGSEFWFVQSGSGKPGLSLDAFSRHLVVVPFTNYSDLGLIVLKFYAQTFPFRWCYTGQLATLIRNACFLHEFADMLHFWIAFKNFQRVAALQMSQKIVRNGPLH